jgi:hypothetical protein
MKQSTKENINMCLFLIIIFLFGFVVGFRNFQKIEVIQKNPTLYITKDTSKNINNIDAWISFATDENCNFIISSGGKVDELPSQTFQTLTSTLNKTYQDCLNKQPIKQEEELLDIPLYNDCMGACDPLCPHHCNQKAR